MLCCGKLQCTQHTPDVWRIDFSPKSKAVWLVPPSPNQGTTFKVQLAKKQ